MSRDLQRRRLQNIRPHLGNRILDLGCGDGSLLELLSSRYSYTGVELNEDMVRRLGTRYPMHRFLVADLEEEVPMPLDWTFDTVVLCAVIEHLAKPQKLLEQMGHVLAHDGRMVVTTPTPLGNRLHRIGALLGLFNLEVKEAHLMVYNRRELETLLEGHGFAVDHYETFELGLNQLLVAVHSRQ